MQRLAPFLYSHKNWQSFLQQARTLSFFNQGENMNYQKLTIIPAVVFALTACDSSEVQMVKGGTLQSCPDKTVEQMVNGYMGQPEWRSFVGEDGHDYVNVTGEITVNNQPTKAEIQFQFNKEKDKFRFNAWELGGKPATDIVASQLFEEMCYADLKDFIKEAVEATINLDKLKEVSSEYKNFDQLASQCGSKISQDGKTEMTFMQEIADCMEQESNDERMVEKLIKPLKKATQVLQKMDSFSEARKKMAEKYIWNDPRMAKQKATKNASVIRPAMSSFKRLLEAYSAETGNLGTWKAIGYESPNASTFTFEQITLLDDFVGAFVVIEGVRATSLVELADCPALSTWTMQCGLNKEKEVVCDCSIKSENKDACEAITPNFTELCK